tara:strand:+ start:386 stop:658 length:273 start_codon:yes stop_codon:yes gene_type:complete
MNRLKSIIKNTWHFIKCEIPELLGNWRFIPRLLMAMYCYAFYAVTTWFMAIGDPTTAQAGFVSVVVGAGAGFFGIYCGTGGVKKEKKEIR